MIEKFTKTTPTQSSAGLKGESSTPRYLDYSSDVLTDFPIDSSTTSEDHDTESWATLIDNKDIGKGRSRYFRLNRPFEQDPTSRAEDDREVDTTYNPTMVEATAIRSATSSDSESMTDNYYSPELWAASTTSTFNVKVSGPDPPEYAPVVPEGEIDASDETSFRYDGRTHETVDNIPDEDSPTAKVGWATRPAAVTQISTVVGVGSSGTGTEMKWKYRNRSSSSGTVAPTTRNSIQPNDQRTQTESESQEL